LLATDGQTHTLRTFDGELYGKGPRYGDGKAPRAYILDWNDPSLWIGWKVRVNEATDFEVALKYTTGSTENGGNYVVAIGDHVIQGNVQPTRTENESATVSLGRVRLTPGEYDLTVKPVDIKGGELMRLFNVSMKPLGAQRSE
jgi:alpha-L-fucosidase